MGTGRRVARPDWTLQPQLGHVHKSVRLLTGCALEEFMDEVVRKDHLEMLF